MRKLELFQIKTCKLKNKTAYLLPDVSFAKDIQSRKMPLLYLIPFVCAIYQSGLKIAINPHTTPIDKKAKNPVKVIFLILNKSRKNKIYYNLIFDYL